MQIVYTVCGKKYPSFFAIFSNNWESLDKILHAYIVFMPNYKIVSNSL